MTSDDQHFLRMGLAASFLMAVLVIVAMVALVVHGPAVPSGTSIVSTEAPQPMADGDAGTQNLDGAAARRDSNRLFDSYR